MFVTERQNRILQHLQMNGFVRSTKLAEELQVSDETIRKDLKYLEKLGRLQRKHGGASKPLPDRFELPMPERTSLKEIEKNAIGIAAAELISPRETIFLDGSSTVLRLAEHLPRIPLTVVTNAHHVVVTLADRSELTLVCTGGIYENRSRSYVGAQAENTSQRFIIRTAFLGVDALDPDCGAMDANHGHGVLKERLINHVDRIILLADSSKLGTRSNYAFAKCDKIQVLITDRNADRDIIARFEDKGIKVLFASR